jgi:hypothetical protein
MYINITFIRVLKLKHDYYFLKYSIMSKLFSCISKKRVPNHCREYLDELEEFFFPFASKLDNLKGDRSQNFEALTESILQLNLEDIQEFYENKYNSISKVD